MPSLTIKNISPTLLEHLRSAAKRDYRSLNSQVLMILDEAARQSLLEQHSATAGEERTREWLADLDAVKERLPPFGAAESWEQVEQAIETGRE